MGTAALARQHINRRLPHLVLPSPREAVRPKPGSNVLAFRKRRFSLRLALPVAGLLVALTVTPAVSRLRHAGASTGAPSAATAEIAQARSERALAGYLISEPIQPVEAPVQLPRTLKLSTYKVQRGESLSSISQKLRLSVDTLISFNGIKRARSLLSGSELRVPNADGLAYTVLRGDTLRGIASAHGVALNAILDWNGLESDIITPGQLLFLPGARLPASVRDAVLGKLMLFPTRGEISSPFGWRQNPFTGIRERHNGLDIRAPIGTSVMAAMWGRVAATGVSPVYGRYIILAHQDGLQTLYGHLSRIVVSRGKTVSQGQKIGEVGNTGYSTGPHLHFTVFRNGVAVDPLSFFD